MRFSLFLLAAAGFASAQPGAVKVWEDEIALPTYREQLPDVVPPFDQLGIGAMVYPYTLRTRLTNEKQPARWRVAHLENEYLHCRVLPDLGGKLYGCLDKLSGAELFYANTSIKKSDTGPRGAWVAGGIETSFPVAHTRLAVSPVHFAMASGPGGAATVVVGATDRVSGMSWQVAYTLRPGSAALEQKVRLYNGGETRQPYQWWTNAAIRLPAGGLRLTYPMYVTAPHGAGTLNSWPINAAGIDMSRTANYTDTLGVFAYGSRDTFFAAYNPENRIGVAHWADPKEVPGKKAWVWAHDGSYNYKDIFSDDHSGYTEIQAGLLETQEMMEFLEPQRERVFTELWVPARDIAGVTRAAPDAVLFLSRRAQPDGAAVVAFDLDATRAIPDAAVKITVGGQTVFEKSAALDPAKTLHMETAPFRAPGKCRFELRDGAGKLLLAHDEDAYDALPASAVKLLAPAPQSAAKGGAEDRALAVLETDELNRLLDKAAVGYQGAVSAHPKSAVLRKAAARFSLMLGRDAEAERVFAALEAEHAADAEARYYHGVAQARLGNDAAARQSWAVVPPDSPFAAAAQFETACALSRSGDRKAAAEIMHRLAAGLPRAAAMEVALVRSLGRDAEAATLAGERLHADPLNSFLRFEATLLGRDDPALWTHLAADPEWVLDVVDDYFYLGMYREPAALLERSYPPVPELHAEPGAVLPQNYPLCGYYLGYARERLGQSAADAWRKASEESTAYAHPSRESSEAVLRAALRQNPADSVAHYLLGALLLNRRMTDEALAEWSLARPGAARIPGYYETVARVMSTVRNDRKTAERFLTEAIAANPSDESLPKVLEKIRGTPASAPAAAPPPAFSSPAEAADFAFGLLAGGHAGEAGKMFVARNFPEEKQPPEVRQAYIETQLQLMIAASRTGHCNNLAAAIDTFGAEDKSLPFTFSSFGAFVKQPRMQFYLGLVEAVCGDRKAAARRWSKVAKASAPLLSADFPFPVLAAAALNPAAAGRTVEPAMEKAQTAAAPEDQKGLLIYLRGVLARAAGRNDEALRLFGEGAEIGPAYLRYLNGAARFDPPLPRM